MSRLRNAPGRRPLDLDGDHRSRLSDELGFRSAPVQFCPTTWRVLEPAVAISTTRWEILAASACRVDRILFVEFRIGDTQSVLHTGISRRTFADRGSAYATVEGSFFCLVQHVHAATFTNKHENYQRVQCDAWRIQAEIG